MTTPPKANGQRFFPIAPFDNPAELLDVMGSAANGTTPIYIRALPWEGNSPYCLGFWADEPIESWEPVIIEQLAQQEKSQALRKMLELLVPLARKEMSTHDYRTLLKTIQCTLSHRFGSGLADVTMESLQEPTHETQ